MNHPPDWDLIPVTALTQSALRTHDKCPRLYNIKYIQLYRPTQTEEPLRFGDMWHQIREAWWRGRFAAAMAKLTELKSKTNEEQLDDFSLARLLVMLRGYHARWNEYVNSVEVLSVEAPFEIPLTNPTTGEVSESYVLRGKTDAIIREKGRLWVVEEKTAKGDLGPESPYWRRLELDPQCSMYYTAVQQTYGEVPEGIKYFVNVKTNLRPAKKTETIRLKKDGQPCAGQRLEDETVAAYAVRMQAAVMEDPDKYYKMVQVTRLEKDVVDSRMDVWHAAHAIFAAERTGIWRRNPDSCIHPYGSACAFLPVCAHRASLEDAMLYRKAEKAHEEL